LIKRRLRPPAALAMVALTIAGCSHTPAKTGTGTGSDKHVTNREKAMKFAQCMRDNGVSEFPDPDPSGELTIDGIANDSSLDVGTVVFKKAISSCKDLQPPGFTGHKRSAEQQDSALAFAQCVRDNGVEDFPDPTPDAPLVDTRRIPSTDRNGGMSMLNAAMQKCGAIYSGALGLKRQ
jgi:hypothetical protein